MGEIFEACFTRLGVPANVVLDVTPVIDGLDENLVIAMDGAVSYAVLAEVVKSSAMSGDVVILALDSAAERHWKLDYGTGKKHVIEVDLSEDLPDLVEIMKGMAKGSVLVIDSLTHLLHRSGVVHFAQSLAALRQTENIFGVVSTWRSCAHDLQVQGAVQTLATSLLTLRPAEEFHNRVRSQVRMG